MAYTHAQVPVMLNRRSAELRGDIVYEGRSCSYCSNTRRYISSHNCVVCAKLRSRVQWLLRRAAARE